MVDFLARILGMLAVGLTAYSVLPVFDWDSLTAVLPWRLVVGLVGGFVGFTVTPFVTTRPLRRGLDSFASVPSGAVVAGVAGMMVGLAIASILSIPLLRIEGWQGWGAPLMLSFVLGFGGLLLGVQRQRDVPGGGASVAVRRGAVGDAKSGARILVDTSAIIDGRIADVAQTGFVTGNLVVPRFVLDELRHIADSGDPLRRARGRRGLEVLNRLRRDARVPLEVLDAELSEGLEVDATLVQLSKAEGASILTTDYNLNRVAEVEGVRVLNLNELAHALKPVVLSGEEITVQIVQEGKEAGQGVGFLDDGTMVVVEGGRRHISERLGVTVTRVLQTAAGRIIFAQPKVG